MAITWLSISELPGIGRKAHRQDRATPDDPKLCRSLTKLTGGARTLFPEVPIDPLFHRPVWVRFSYVKLAI